MGTGKANRHKSWPWLALMLCACGPEASDSLDYFTAAAEPVLVSPATRFMAIVAHQDDDLLFLNPTVDNVIKAGGSYEVVYITSGDTGKPMYFWQSRERGVEAAYAHMAGVPDNWTVDAPTFGGKVIHRARLNGSKVTVIFLRTPTGGSGTGFPTPSDDPYRPAHASLWKLWSGQIPSIPVVGTWTTPNGVSYTVSDLDNILLALVNDFAPTHIGTQESSGASAKGDDFFYGREHSDHLHAAKFAFRAHLAYTTPHTFSMYRDDNISDEQVDLSSAESDRKLQIFGAYARYHMCLRGEGCYAHCVPACYTAGGYAAYGTWIWRSYPVTELTSTSGWIAGIADKCLQVRGGNFTNGTPVEIRDCAKIASQKWSVGDGKIKIATLNKCLDDRGPLNSSTTTPVQIWDCSNSATTQKWSLTDDGMLRGLDGKCLDILNGSSANGTPTQMSNCQHLQVSSTPVLYVVDPRQSWTPRFGEVAAWSHGIQFADRDAGGTFGQHSSYYGSLRLADVDGDGEDDLCARRPDGIYCALKTSGASFASYTKYTAAFSDAQGWLPEKYGMTIQFGDLNADGRADVCGRDTKGLWCATASPTGRAFLNPKRWGTAFSDAAGFGKSAAYYGSMRLVDVNKDGYADVCGRSSTGIVCAINNRHGAFNPATAWLPTEFTDAGGWGDEKYGITIQFADLDGDGRPDVCGRSPETIVCAINSGTSFRNPRRWAFRNDFSDAAGWGAARSEYASIRLVDVNADGFADVCGRSAAGVVCAFGNGTSFDLTRRVQPRYTDASGWGGSSTGMTIQFGRFNFTGRRGMCGRSTTRVDCSYGL